MDCRREARDFLQTRRAKLTPPRDAPGSSSNRRRVPGLRREEVAQLAGVSVDYYTRLEKGHLETASYAVLTAVARALQLGEVETDHLLALARASRGESCGPAPRTTAGVVRDGTRWMLDSMLACPAYVRSGRLDVVAANAMARVVWEPMFESGVEMPNLAAFCFLDARAQVFFTEWPSVARGTLALLRAEVGRHPADPALDELVEQLLADSVEFATLWADHEVLEAFSAIKRLQHPRVGALTLAIETQAIVADPGLTMVAYAAEPGSPSEAALHLLSAATHVAEPETVAVSAS